MSEKEKLDETQRRIAACLNAFDGIPTEKIDGKNLGEILAGEMLLNNAGPREGGGFGFEFSGGVCQLMAESFAEQFKHSGAINYLELLFDHSDIGPLTITMQRVDGLTPAHKLAKAESERDALQQKLDAVLAENLMLKEAAVRALEEVQQSYDSDGIDSEDGEGNFQDACIRLCDAESAIEGVINRNTPATDAILNAVRAEAIEHAAEKAPWLYGDQMGRSVEAIPKEQLIKWASQLRAETDTTPSQYESLAGGK